MKKVAILVHSVAAAGCSADVDAGVAKSGCRMHPSYISVTKKLIEKRGKKRRG